MLLSKAQPLTQTLESNSSLFGSLSSTTVHYIHLFERHNVLEVLFQLAIASFVGSYGIPEEEEYEQTKFDDAD
jgi:hypothetical protein